MLAWPYPRVLAHRGAGALAPENTLAAIRVGAEHGFRAVEFDAMLPGDDTPILMHDPTLQRTAGVAAAVSDFGAAALARLDVGSWYSPQFSGEPIPTLADALALCRRVGVWPNVEIKPVPGSEAATGAAVATVVAHCYADLLTTAGAPGSAAQRQLPLLSSFAAEALLAARAAQPDLPRGWLTDRVPPDWQRELERLDCVAVHTNHRYLKRQQAAAIKDAGAWLFCFTVNDPRRAAELLDWGVDAFCTDRIDLIGPDFASRG
jgi:glycerophosphoryl diester phosphodiesterase